MLVGLLLLATRWMERWLYRHLFKVGWLFSHNLQATTIFFYLIFLPGIALHEAAVWLVAGVFNVRADRALTWPATQSEARIRLDFVKLDKKAGLFSLAIINLSPLIVGLIALWLIVVTILRVDVAAAGFTGDLGTIPAIVQQVTRAPDFWLWFYIAFTIANTMFPSDTKALRGWRIVALGVGAFVGLIFLLGLGNLLVGGVTQGPVRDGATLLAGLLGFVIAADLVVTLVLRIIETIVEAVTGSSATYHNGKLVALTRAEVKQQRAQARIQADRTAKGQKAAVSYKTVYDLALPIPPAPGKLEAVTVEKPAQPVLGGGGAPPATPLSAPSGGWTSPAPLPASGMPAADD
ncbi:MAG TPA: hypothetical protein VER79_13655 [Candidatus Limnocylindrales bacterium]|nr:hypothetical protein [Candidatus Limnocylindrales bacterium]